jgi:hypothetical protein
MNEWQRARLAGATEDPRVEAPSMKETQSTCKPPMSSSCMPKISVIYEDRASGVRGKHFADNLTAALADEGERRIAMWRGELLDLPGVADHVSRDAAQGEFVILSLRGDTGLPVSTKHLVEAWLQMRTRETAGLIALFDPQLGESRIVASICSYLGHVASAAGIAFFSQHTLVSATTKMQTHPSGAMDMPESNRNRARRINRQRLYSEALAA